MKISRRWLRRISGVADMPPASELAAILTGRGLEVESADKFADAEGIVIGKVLTAAAHPDADKLKLCTVNTGGEAQSIVCGAPNVAAGMTVAVAAPGARIGKTRITARSIRGVESAGMICSALELGIGEDAAGILQLEDELVAGADAAETLALDDDILDVAITPNRGDCLSHLGIAREVCAHLNIPLPSPPPPQHKADIDEVFPVRIDAAEACPFYGCVIIRDVNCALPSPVWLRTLLERCGMRAINAVVDITNYLAIVWGQPAHAFDLDKLNGGIVVRYAAAGENITLLDGTKKQLAADDLLIADHHQPAALGGVMGGLTSAVGADTKNILIEAASFAPEAVRGKTRRHQLTSEAAFRFERGVDSSLPPNALAIAARLIKTLCGGKAGNIHSAGSQSQSRAPICADGNGMRGLLGMPDITNAAAAKMLRASGIETETREDGMLVAVPPLWRFDLHIAADIAEEVARAWGYHRIKATVPKANAPLMPPADFAESRLRRFFAARGFFEIVSYAFVPREWERRFGDKKAVALQNPISEEMAVMRTQLFAGLMAAARFNAGHRQERGALFEIGKCFYHNDESESDNLPQQPQQLGALVWGAAKPLQWHGNRAADLYDLKGVVEDMLPDVIADSLAEDKTPPVFHPRRAAALVVGGEMVGMIGECHPRLADDWGFRSPPLMFELSLDKLRRSPPAKVREVSRFPLVWRDVAMLAPSDGAVGGLLAKARAAAKAPVIGVELFDCYAGDNLPSGKKSFALRITMQGKEKNLTDKDINKAEAQVCAVLAAFGAQVREQAGEAKDRGEEQ
ncbi:MAG: phenylalanine--tRNA ligase subunit beta [Gammaproteobacteria bacterium]